MGWNKRDAAPQVDTIGLEPPSASIYFPSTPDQPPTYISWGKRQDEAEPTPAPEDPDEGPIEIPPFPQPTQPNSIGLQPPQATVIWGKRQDDGGEDPEDPSGPIEIPPGPAPTQPNSIGIQPPQATVIWGKRDNNPDDTVGLQPPRVSVWFPKPTPGPKPPSYVSWDRRQDEPVTTEIPPASQPAPPNEISVGKPTASVGWGKERRLRRGVRA